MRINQAGIGPAQPGVGQGPGQAIAHAAPRPGAPWAALTKPLRTDLRGVFATNLRRLEGSGRRGGGRL